MQQQMIIYIFMPMGYKGGYKLLFKIRRSVPANTLASNPDFQKLSIAKGTIIEWLVQMPTECADITQLRVEYHNTQILPFSGSTWLYGLFEPTPIRENIKIDDGPYDLDIYAFNLDDSYSHEYNLYCNVEPVKPITPGEIMAPGWWDQFKGLFGGA